MKTVVVQIGNSDDKLSQKRWSEFVMAVGGIISGYSRQIYFFGASHGHESWQNSCWVFELDGAQANSIKEHLGAIARRFGQDSIVYMEGITEFIS